MGRKEKVFLYGLSVAAILVLTQQGYAGHIAVFLFIGYAARSRYRK